MILFQNSDEPTVPSSRVNEGGDDNPYQTAIEGYKSFAQSHLRQTFCIQLFNKVLKLQINLIFFILYVD